MDVHADPFVEPPHVRSAAVVTKPLRLNLAQLKDLGQKHGTVKVLKAMQCLNVDSPLGQGVFEGIPLSTVLKECGKIENCRRIYYWGFHNNDDRQIFRSSLSYTEAFENVPGEPPVFLAFKLNGKPLPLERGGPVRMIVPFGHGFKSVKFVQQIRLTNDYRANDTYAAIDEGDEGNDPGSVQKTYTTVDLMRGAPAVARGEAIRLSGILMNGRTPARHLEYWVRGPHPTLEKGQELLDDDAELLAGPWIQFALPAPPADLQAVLPDGISAVDLFGTDAHGVPHKFPLPFSYSSWSTDIQTQSLAVGFYEIRARAVDEAGNAQPEPRPYRKNGRNSVQTRRVEVK
jgi:DMSO/TMAO reductase YedYZ molybdopterin-dependent catalytic subunit